MASFKIALGSGATGDGMIGEIRQRLLTNMSGSTDPGVASDTAIKRRLNLRYLRWAAELAQMEGQGISKDVDFTITSPDTTYTLPDDFMSMWQLYRYDNAAKTRKTPVTMISPRDADRYDAPVISLGLDESAPRRFMAYIAGPILHFVTRGTSAADVAGDYQERYYYYPEELSDAADVTILPAQLDEVLISDTTASLAADGGMVKLQLAQAEMSRQLLREFWQRTVKKDRVSNRRIKDVMGYGNDRTRFGGLTWP